MKRGAEVHGAPALPLRNALCDLGDCPWNERKVRRIRVRPDKTGMRLASLPFGLGDGSYLWPLSLSAGPPPPPPWAHSDPASHVARRVPEIHDLIWDVTEVAKNNREVVAFSVGWNGTQKSEGGTVPLLLCWIGFPYPKVALAGEIGFIFRFFPFVPLFR